MTNDFRKILFSAVLGEILIFLCPILVWLVERGEGTLKNFLIYCLVAFLFGLLSFNHRILDEYYKGNFSFEKEVNIQVKFISVISIVFCLVLYFHKQYVFYFFEWKDRMKNSPVEIFIFITGFILVSHIINWECFIKLGLKKFKKI